MTERQNVHFIKFLPEKTVHTTLERAHIPHINPPEGVKNQKELFCKHYLAWH